MSSKSPSSLAKPLLSQAAMAFAEAGKPKAASREEGAGDKSKRTFFAPEGHRRLTINIPIPLHKRLKRAAIDQECTATDIIMRLLTEEFGESL